MHVDEETRTRLADLGSAHIADACLRAALPIRCAPPGLSPVTGTMAVRGRARPVRHYGSVDIFLEALDHAEPGDVLVIDNAGRVDEACIGDLIAVETQAAGLQGIVVWGLHRDTAQLVDIALPVFSLGAIPVGPQRLDPRGTDAFTTARVGEVLVDDEDWVVADADGVVFVHMDDLAAIARIAADIRDAEVRQAMGVSGGRSLRDQLAFADFRRKAAEDPGYTLRQHLIDIGGAIET